MKLKKYWFTLVELIIVITILSILGTIWFISFSWYSLWTRDANRISQLATMQVWLEVYGAKSTLPIPENSVEVRASGTLIWYEWYIWNDILKLIEYSQWWRDPKDEKYFTYYLNDKMSKFQLMAYLESEWNKQITKNEKWKQIKKSLLFVSKVYALDYIKRYPAMMWSKIWLITESITNIPIHEVSSIISSWYLDIIKTNDSYKANYTDFSFISWTGSNMELVKEIHDNPIKSCLSIFKSWNWSDNWEYTINPTWIEWWEYNVYCDMESDWGWWTLVLSAWNNKVIPVWTTTELSKENLLKSVAPWKLSDSDINLIYYNQFRTTTTNSGLINYKLYWSLIPGKVWNYTTTWQKSEHMKTWLLYKENWAYTIGQWLYVSETYFAFNHRGAMDVWYNYANYTRYYESNCCITKPDIFLWVR